MSRPIVTRFAPSPTGLMHLGNVRTALLNWLYAARFGGRFLLRFEDTDQSRSELEYIEAIKSDLQWLGLTWHGDALFQSQHAGQHEDALIRLAEQGKAYRCFCSEHQLNLDRKLATSRGLPPRYTGRCRALSGEEAKNRAASEPFVWRLAVHADDGVVTVPDALHGDVTFACRDLDDPVVRRSDGSFTFLLPNAVDDAADGITHVLRGDDHLTNSAYQVWLLEQLGHEAPVYLHHGLLLGQDGGKLSKRSGSHSVAELRAEGLLPMALVQSMARLGHPNIDESAHTLADLCEHFEASHVSTSSVRWSDEEMWRWHSRLLHELDVSELVAMLTPIFPNLDDERLHVFATLIGRNISRVEEARLFARLIDAEAEPEAEGVEVIANAGSTFYREALAAWDELAEPDWKGWVDRVKALTGCKGKALFMPLRVALTGAVHGPEMSDVVAFLGEDGIRARLQSAERRVA